MNCRMTGCCRPARSAPPANQDSDPGDRPHRGRGRVLQDCRHAGEQSAGRLRGHRRTFQVRIDRQRAWRFAAAADRRRAAALHGVQDAAGDVQRAPARRLCLDGIDLRARPRPADWRLAAAALRRRAGRIQLRALPHQHRARVAEPRRAASSSACRRSSSICRRRSGSSSIARSTAGSRRRTSAASSRRRVSACRCSSASCCGSGWSIA